MKSYTITAIVFFYLTLVGLADINQEAKDILILMRSNLESFKYVTCDYELISGLAATETDAMNGKWTSSPAPAISMALGGNSRRVAPGSRVHA